jgi:hypothetical protein
MDFRTISIEDKKKFSELMFEQLSSAHELKDWVRLFLGLELPLEITDPESTSSPLDSIWQVYETFKNNTGYKNPGYIMLSCREGMKTVSVAILEILLLLHFQLDIGHAAAVETQSAVALQYIGGFILNIEPLLDYAGWKKTSENKRLIKYTTPQNKQPFIKVVICSPKGMNSLHSNVIFLDELDLADPKALKEGKNITGYSKGIHGVTVYLSTRKYAFGNMATAIEKAPEMNYKILRWNILDVTEVCSPDRFLPDGEKKDMYVGKNLPLTAIQKDEYDFLADSEKVKYDLIPQAHKGCQSCLLLPVCRGRLAEKSKKARGGFYKPITTVLQKFRENDADTAEAQLMCWRPGSEGLVYPRFSVTPGKGNVLSVREVYEKIFGPTTKSFISEVELLYEMQKLDISFYAGVDWGFTHDSVIIIVALLPTGEVIVMDCFAAPGLEFQDVLTTAIAYRDKYRVVRWFCDPAMPSSLKSFNRHGMKSPSFKKDVLGGIDAVRSKIINSAGSRALFVMDTKDTKKVVSAIMKHRFKMDGQGNLTVEPDDDRGIADICDSMRYIGQNLFPVKGSYRPGVAWTDAHNPMEQANQNPANTEIMKNEISRLVGDQGKVVISSGKKGGFHFNF